MGHNFLVEVIRSVKRHVRRHTAQQISFAQILHEVVNVVFPICAITGSGRDLLVLCEPLRPHVPSKLLPDKLGRPVHEKADAAQVLTEGILRVGDP